jgi:hypothetical protein
MEKTEVVSVAPKLLRCGILFVVHECVVGDM